MTASVPPTVFDPGCRDCPRLAAHLDRVRADFPGYHAAPVAPFGPTDARLLIVGLAPGMHGANATGRPFTGDHAGILLYRSLYEIGLANQPEATRIDDGLELYDCRVTNAVKCLPPGNRPHTVEIRTCNAFLAAEIARFPPRVVLALGRVAHDAVLRALARRLSAHPFGHGREYGLDGAMTLIDSYHCSRYNTQTGRLTAEMFRDVLARAAALREVSETPGRADGPTTSMRGQ